MRKLKYLFVFLVAICFVPSVVNATQDVYYKDYKVGDKITVTLDKDGKVKKEFIVIQATPEGTDKNVAEGDEFKVTKDYHTVKAIYSGTIGESKYTENTGETTYDKSIPYSVLPRKAQDLGWINYSSISLLTYMDIHSMIRTLPVNVQKEIYIEREFEESDEIKCTTDSDGNMSCTGSYPFKPIGQLNDIDWTVLKKYLPFVFLNGSYWLGDDTFVGNTCVPTADTVCPAVYDPKNIALTITANGLKRTVASDSASLRPVITIHKGFVEGGMICNCEDCEEDKPEVPVVKKVCPNDSKISIQACIDGGQTEEACIKKLCPGTQKTENPKTSSYLPLFGIVVAGIIASCVYVSTKNKTYFRKVK